MAVYTVSILADGQLAAAKAAIYTVAAATRAIISTITLVNESTTLSRTVNLYVLPSGGTSRRIIPVNLPLGAKYSLIFDDELTLGPLDAIEGDASVANDVDYTIHGVQEA